MLILLLPLCSREAAFTYAISSAGVAYAVTAACSRGNISTCGCDPRHKERKELALQGPGPSGWKWGGCSVDMGFGMRFARKFLDAREIERDARSLMNLHNNKAGRKTECKCHGVSGSCTMKTCWKTLPPFRLIGDHLMHRYWRARGVSAVPVPSASKTSTREVRPLQLTLRRARSVQKTPKRSELVFLQSSPNYCERNLSMGSLGTNPTGAICSAAAEVTTHIKSPDPGSAAVNSIGVAKSSAKSAPRRSSCTPASDITGTPILSLLASPQKLVFKRP
ncbi:unnamed protein product [Bemisia tabaci]|uniref:Protein Wnt n=1 Tax=Bemisia tabaci TaxID=7038 RepID=A0A9P0AI89_BEMTA|nr:unnamed protein product [Bemisia tabaci]